MNKTEIIESISQAAGISVADATKALNATVENITSALCDGKQVVIPGFGTFSVSYRAARKGRNPRTGETIDIKAARVAKFKAGKALKDAVDGSEAEAN